MTTENLSNPLTGAPLVINPTGAVGPAPFTPPAQWQPFVAGQAYQAGPPASGCIGPDGNGYVRIVTGADTVWTPANWLLFSLAGEQATAQGTVAAAQSYATQAGAFAAAAEEAAQNAVAAATTMEFFTRAAFLAATSIPSTVQYVHVWGVNGTPFLLGQFVYGTSDLTYKNEGTAPSGVVGEVLVQGNYWRPLYDIGDGFVDAGQFVGVIGDASFNWGTGVATGTDNLAGLQSALDFAMQNGLIGVKVPRGAYLYNGTLYLGYGYNYTSLHLIGSPGTGGADPGVSFFPQATDRPAIAISGGYSSLIRGIYIVGKNLTWLTTLFSSPAIPSSASAYLNPAITPAGNAPGGLQPHSPYCAICIDPQAGAAPADAYAAMPAPTWAGGSGVATSYGRIYSTETVIDGCAILGFPIAIANSPNDADQGDMTSVTNCDIKYFVYGVAVGNNKSRNVRVSDNRFFNGHTCITGSVTGNTGGRFDGPIDNNNSTTTYQLIYFNGMGYTGNLNIRNWYCENTVRIGEAVEAAGFCGAVRFEACSLNLLEDLHGTIPPFYLQTDGSPSVEFDSCNVTGSRKITGLVGPNFSNTSVKGGFFWSARGAPGASSVSAPFAQAVNYFGGLLAPNLSRVTGTYYSSPTSGIGSRLLDEAVLFNNAQRVGLTYGASYFKDSLNNRRYDMTVMAPQLWDINGDTLRFGVAPTWANDIVTLTVSSYLFLNAAGFWEGTPSVGSIVLHYNSGTIFLVTAIAGPGTGGSYTITMQQQNNMQVNTATGAFVANLLTDFTLAGYCWLFNTNLTIPSAVYWGNFTQGNANVTNVHRGDGYGGNLNQFLAAGDILVPAAIDDPGDPWPIAAGSTIFSVTNGSPGSIVLSQPATVTGRFPVFPTPIH